MPAGQDTGDGMTDAELRGLLMDCLALWGVAGRVSVTDAGLQVITGDGVFVLQRASEDMHPVRWLLRTPVREAAGRPPRAAPSIVAALTALRNALGAQGGAGLRIGSTA